MDIALDAVLAAVAEVKGKSAPCMLDSIQDLIRTVCGEAPGPCAPFFLRDCAIAGLIALQQYPVLDTVQFPEDCDTAQYATWLRREKARLGLQDSYDIQTPAEVVLAAAQVQGSAIAKKTIEHLKTNP